MFVLLVVFVWLIKKSLICYFWGCYGVSLLGGCVVVLLGGY